MACLKWYVCSFGGYIWSYTCIYIYDDCNDNLIFIYKLIVPFKNIYDYTPYLMSFVVYVGGCYAYITYKKTNIQVKL